MAVYFSIAKNIVEQEQRYVPARDVASLVVLGGQEFHFPHFFHKFRSIFSHFSSNFTCFLPHFGPPRGQVAHPGRPWLRPVPLILPATRVPVSGSLYLFPSCTERNLNRINRSLRFRHASWNLITIRIVELLVQRFNFKVRPRARVCVCVGGGGWTLYKSLVPEILNR